MSISLAAGAAEAHHAHGVADGLAAAHQHGSADPVWMLVASLVALAIGPLIHWGSRRFPAILAGLDGFVFMSVGAMVLIHALPEAYQSAGFASLLFAAFGFAGPLFIERWLHAAADAAHRAALILALIGLVVHALVDGAVLASGGEALPLAVILHRLPVGLTLWLLLRGPYGTRVALAVIGVVAGGTLMGYGLGHHVLDRISPWWSGSFTGLVAGSLLHVVVHRGGGSEWSWRGWRVAAGLGGVAGLIVATLVDSHDHGVAAAGHSIWDTFLAFSLESAPALLLAYVVAGLVHAFLPDSGLAWLAGGSRASQAMRGVAFGLPLPMCSCGVVPVYRSLVLKGVPPAAALAFFVATPELGAEAVFLSLPLLGVELTIVRVVAAAAVAFVVGVLVAALADGRAPAGPTPAPTPDASFKERLKAAVQTGLADMVDSTMPWIIVGIGLAAALDPILADPGSLLHRVPAAWQIPLFALIGLPSYVCASGATPLVAIVVAHGVSPGAALAFLLTGPATNVTTFGVLAELHGKRVAAAFGVAMALAAIGAGFITNAILGSTITVPEPHMHLDGAGLLQQVSLGLLVVLVALSLLRQGPRGLVGQVIPMANGSHDHGSHDHGHHDHDHDHHDHDHDDQAHPDPPPDPACCH
ncbi:MAG: uncharacterized membrane protein YraQ (UPF0718 family) [Myxococcota bacterium]|jgi:uncharacterized membrane protein YraQ (UPF0718 family)